MTKPRLLRALPLVAAATLLPPLAGAESFSFRPAADAGLFENDLDRNTGGSPALQIGLNNNGKRGLYRFDLSEIPRGSIVTSISL